MSETSDTEKLSGTFKGPVALPKKIWRWVSGLIRMCWRRARPQERRGLNTETEKLSAEFEEQVLSVCGPIYIAPSLSSRPSEITANGSFGLIDTGERKLLITCCHVWDYYLDAKARRPDTIIAVVLGTGFKAYAFDPVLIDCDRDIDLAVFDWNGNELGEKAFFPVRVFPIASARPGDLIAIQGFPGVHREATEVAGKFGAFFVGTTVTAVNDRKVLISNSGTRSLRSVKTKESLAPFALGGMSGSPA